MTEMTLDVPAKPTDMAAFWPKDGRKEYTNKDGVWIQYRDITIGPFPNRTEASWYDGQVQEIVMGWIGKDRFAGRLFPFGDVWYVERWETNDGPFMSLGAAVDHRQELYDGYRKAIADALDNRKDDYVGVVFQQSENRFWIDRGRRANGPFATREEAEKYRDLVLAKKSLIETMKVMNHG